MQKQTIQLRALGQARTLHQLTALSLVAALLLLAACVAHSPLGGRRTESAPVPAGTDAVARIVAELKAGDSAADELDPIGTTHFELASPEQDVVGVVQLIRTRADDTLSDIARTYGLGYDDVVHANPGIDPWLPGAGTPIVLPTQFVLPPVLRRGIVLNIAAKRLYYFPEPTAGSLQQVVTHPIGIGRVGWATPVGAAKIIAKAKDPTWYVPLSVRKEHAELGDPLPAVVPPGDDNPLGHRVLKLDMEGYLIHGTNQPYGVGMRVSHGCVRLYPENIETLYDAVGLGTPVSIVNEPVVGGWLDGVYYLQVHPALEDDDRDTGALAGDLIAKALQQSKYADAGKVQALAKRAVERAQGYPVNLFGRGAESFAPGPRSVKNIVVVDNPVSEEELEELLSDAAEPQS